MTVFGVLFKHKEHIIIIIIVFGSHNYETRINNLKKRVLLHGSTNKERNKTK